MRLREPKEGEALVFSEHREIKIVTLSDNVNELHIAIITKNGTEYVALKSTRYVLHMNVYTVLGKFAVDDNGRSKLIESLIERFWGE